MHREIPVKVNAWVDSGIAPLVCALNEILCIYTVDSCQGRKGRPAYVYFRYLGSEKHEPAFVSFLAKMMAQQCAREWLYTITMEWNSGEQPLLQIQCAPEAVPRVSQIIHAVAKSDRMTAYLYGKVYREPHS